MTTRSLSLVLALFVSATAALAADSSQFRGAHRTGMFDETGLMKTWPEDGPPLLWKAAGFGVGYSSADVVKDRIYVTGTLAEQESFIFVLDLDGKIIEKIPYGKETTAESAPGARCTPTI